jgi:hypothetical protein
MLSLRINGICVDHIPFMQSESQKFLSSLNSEVKQHVSSGDTVRARTLELFEKKKEELAELLHSVDKIHISFDGWTAPNGRGEQSIRQMRYESCPHCATTQ